MKIVIDENVLLRSVTYKDPQGNYDHFAIDLMIEAMDCKHTICVSSEIEDKYKAQFEKVKNGVYGQNISNPADIYTRLKNTTGKIEMIPGNSNSNFQHVPNERNIKPDDIPFARLAHHVHSILVTYDGPLKQAMGTEAKEPRQLIGTQPVETNNRRGREMRGGR